MASPGQKHGGCGYLMTGFHTHSYCARCRDKGKGKDPCVEKPDTDCKLCNLLTSDQKVGSGGHGCPKKLQMLQWLVTNCSICWILMPTLVKPWPRKWSISVTLCLFHGQSDSPQKGFLSLTHVRSGIKPDTLAALRTAPLQLATLFLDSVLKKAKEDISDYDSKGRSGGTYKKGRYHPYEHSHKR